MLQTLERRELVLFFVLGASPIDSEYDPLIYGVQQVEGIDYETLSSLDYLFSLLCKIIKLFISDIVQFIAIKYNNWVFHSL